MAEPATAPESAEPILRLRGIARRFGGVHAVQDVDLEVYRRGFLVVGPIIGSVQVARIRLGAQ